MESVVCTKKGAAHKARNCLNHDCSTSGLCQFGPHTLNPKPTHSCGIDCAWGCIAFNEVPNTALPYPDLPAQLAAMPPLSVPKPSAILPTDKQARKDTPISSGVLDYFTAAIAEIARVSKAGNDQHNPGQPLHWARGKSMDHSDCIVRHLLERGTVDTDGMRHSAKMAWRALALLQEELEAEGAPMSRASKVIS